MLSGYVWASQARIFIRIFHQATIDVAAANDSSGERRAVDHQPQLLPFLPPGISISLAAAGGGKAAPAAAPVSPGVSPPLGNTPPPAPYFPAKCPTCDKGGRSSESLKWRHFIRKEDGMPDISYLQGCGSVTFRESDPYLCLTDSDADPEHR